MEVKEYLYDFKEIDKKLVRAIYGLQMDFKKSFFVFQEIYNLYLEKNKEDVDNFVFHSTNRIEKEIIIGKEGHFEDDFKKLKENLQNLVKINQKHYHEIKAIYSVINSFFLRHLIINGFKTFEKQEIDFENRVNLIIGNNGVGKTTILDSISLALAQCISSMKPGEKNKFKKIHVPKLKNEDIKLGMKACYIEADFEYNDSILCEKIEKSLSPNEKKNVEDMKETLPSLGESIITYYKKYLSLPIISYHCISKGNNNSVYNEIDDFRKGYVGCLNGRANVKEVKKWLNIMKKDSKKGDTIQLFFDIVNYFMACIDDQGIIVLDEYRFDNNAHCKLKKMEYDYELYYTYKDFKIKFTQMSSGYQQILNMVMDIAYRMIILNKDIAYPRFNLGIVLIDEIDLHLHPKWQWNVLSALHTVFPNVQFIVTTHSPFILSSCEDCNVIVLDRDGVSNAKAYGKSIHNIVEHIFGTYIIPENLSKLYQEFEEYIFSENYEAAETKRDEMKKEYGEENEIVKEASWRLEFSFDDE